MMLLLQIIGGALFLFNKFFLYHAEHAEVHDPKRARQSRVLAWAVYILGLPPWVILFIVWNNWIAALVEASGVPAMVIGLLLAIKGRRYRTPRWMDVVTVAAMGAGFFFSFRHFNGFNTINQLLETIMVIGYLIGTYALAKQKTIGYACYILMHISCGALMYIQGSPWLMLQQTASLIFIALAWRSALQPQTLNPSQP